VNNIDDIEELPESIRKYIDKMRFLTCKCLPNNKLYHMSCKKIIGNIDKTFYERGFIVCGNHDTITKDFGGLFAIDTEQLIIECSAEGYPKTILSFHTHPGQTVLPSNFDILSFSDPKVQYMCIGRNSSGKARIACYEKLVFYTYEDFVELVDPIIDKYLHTSRYKLCTYEGEDIYNVPTMKYVGLGELMLDIVIFDEETASAMEKELYRKIREYIELGVHVVDMYLIELPCS